MAKTFNRTAAKAVGTSVVTLITCPANTQMTLVGLSLCNILAAPITASAYITISGVGDIYLVANVPIAPGGTLPVMGGEQKHNLLPTDVLKVVASAANSLDVLASTLDSTP